MECKIQLTMNSFSMDKHLILVGKDQKDPYLDPE
ncbi:hypothetical protein ES703_72688 [subsurface metagenome]